PETKAVRSTDKALKSTNFKLPHWIYNLIHSHYEKKHYEMSYIYKKDKTKIKNHIVFLGFNYGFQGNSRYLFNHFAKHFSKLPVFFITKDVSGLNLLIQMIQKLKHLLKQQVWLY